MKILATDLDRTLLPNGEWEADSQAIPLFNQLTQAQPLLLVYVTGRNLALTEAAISRYGIRYPDVLCSDVGTAIRYFRQGSWSPDPHWQRFVLSQNPRWDAADIAAALSRIEGLQLQETEHLSALKCSYYLPHPDREAVLGQARQALRKRFDATLVYSFDTQQGRGLLDILPEAATKRTALEYLASKTDTPLEQVIFCGDSGNDIAALTAHFSGVVVKNADSQLRQQLDQALATQPELRLYFARGGFRGLNGKYASGIIEGCYHYGLFDQ
jgi:hypothetical protein